MNDGVRTLLYDSAAQRLYAFGHFSVAGGVTVNGTTYWDGDWHPMGQGVHYPQAFPVMTAGFWGDSILISGSFPYAYGVDNSQKAVVWDGGAWQALEPGGIVGYIGAIVSNQDGATVAGIMDTIAGVPIANNIARYSNNVWSSICSHPTDGLMWFVAMAHYQGQYFFAGNLNSPSVKELGWLDGDTLRQVGQGILGDSWVQDLVVFQDRLFIGGDFYSGAGNPGSGLMTWDGTAYADPVPGVQFTTQVVDLDVRNDELFISGRSQLPGSSDYYTLARYDGERICLFGKNLNTVFLAIAASETELFAAPNMNTLGLGGDTVNYIARYDLSFPADTCIDLPTGLRPQPVRMTWSFNPNPATHSLAIQCADGFPSGTKLSIMDGMGRVLDEVGLPTASHRFDLDLTRAPTGLLFAVVTDSSGVVLARERVLHLSP